MVAFLDKFRFTRKPFREGNLPAGRQGKAEEKLVPTKDVGEVLTPSSSDTGTAYRVLIRPLVTEKGTRLADSGQYVFMVATNATRIAVARAVEKVYGVRPARVNIVRVSGKQVRFGRTVGRQKDWKKAFVTLPPGKKIRVYEGV